MPKKNEGFIRAVKRLHRQKHKRLPRGYKKDPKEYKEITLDDD